MVLAVLLLLAQKDAAVQTGSVPAMPKIDWAKAKRMFEANCGACHGLDGKGGRGPNIASQPLARATNEVQLLTVIARGVPGTEMPPSAFLGADGVVHIAAYVKKLAAESAPQKAEGDPAKGRALYEGKGNCASCHTIAGAGRAYGPDLSHIGARRSPENLAQSIEDPAAEVPEGFLMIRAVTREGSEVNGIRVNEDSFTVQLVDGAGRFHSLRKAGLQQLDKRKGATPMPAYQGIFTREELRDLVAYLSSLRGVQ
jgi:putative heme-binding domain-containing protein